MLDAYEELIDTQWDVNCEQNKGGYTVEVELIDTQWDVNAEEIAE